MTNEEWKILAENKLAAAEKQMSYGEWAVAAELMAYSLECYLKAACCHTLKLPNYPPKKAKKNEEDSYFKTHELETLKTVSGMYNKFTLTKAPRATTKAALKNWSDFTTYFPGNWPAQRYNQQELNRFDEQTVRGLYSNLFESKHSIIKTIRKAKRW